jgi:hypothetical protein
MFKIIFPAAVLSLARARQASGACRRPSGSAKQQSTGSISSGEIATAVDEAAVSRSQLWSRAGVIIRPLDITDFAKICGCSAVMAAAGAFAAELASTSVALASDVRILALRMYLSVTAARRR